MQEGGPGPDVQIRQIHAVAADDDLRLLFTCARIHLLGQQRRAPVRPADFRQSTGLGISGTFGPVATDGDQPNAAGGPGLAASTLRQARTGYGSR